MNNKGYTLLEVLGVVIILSLLTLFVFPSVLNFIKDTNSKIDSQSMKLISHSADMYIKANQDDFPKHDGNKFIIEMDTLMNNGDIPNSIKLSDIENIRDKCVQVSFNKNKYTYELKDKGTCEKILKICTLASDSEKTGTEIGAKYNCKVDPDKEPYTFFILSYNDKDGNITQDQTKAVSVNLIMDSNIRTGGEPVKESNPTSEQKGYVQWISKEDYTSKEIGGKEEDYGTDGNWNKGPITAMNYLQDATKNWTNLIPLKINTFTSNTGKVYYMPKTYETFARMPYYNEINELDETHAYLFDYLLKENTSQANPVAGVSGYWMSSSSSNYNNYVWIISYASSMYGVPAYYSRGVRPVITLPKGSLSSGLFYDDSWKTIVANVRSGNTSNYKVGDTKEVKLEGFTNEEEGSNGLYTVRIANTSTPSECNTTGFSQTACGFVIEFVDIITTHAMNSTATNVGGWRDSEMRSYVNSTIYDSLPEELKNNIIDTYVVSGHGSTSGEANFKVTDKLYLLSTKEVWGKEGTSNKVSRDTAEAETRQLDYYKNKGVTTNNYSGAIKKLNGSTKSWFLRSAFSNSARNFYDVDFSGDWIDYLYANTTDGVAVAFRIG